MALQQHRQWVEGEDEVVTGWRMEELRRAGYDERAALMLALHTEVDLHLATDLLRRGCPEATALRILL